MLLSVNNQWLSSHLECSNYLTFHSFTFRWIKVSIKTSFIRCSNRKFKFAQRVKVTQGLLHFRVLEKAVFSSHMIGLQLRKIKMYLINCIRAYMGDHGNPLKAQISVQKVSFQLETNRVGKKSSIFQFLAGLGVSVQIVILGPCEIVKLQIS